MKLAFLQELYEHPGPFATVYLDTSADAEDAAKARELRWRSAKEQLRGKGAERNTVSALEDYIGEHEVRSGVRGQVLVATNGQVVFTDELPEPPTQFSDDELVMFGPVPQLMPYMHMRRARIPHLIAMVDRIGADITIVDETRDAGSTTIEGGDSPHHKSHTAGEGNEKRHHNAVEEQWKSNADDIAEEITKHARENAVEVIVVGGDVEQRSLIQDRLRKGIEAKVVEAESSHRGRPAIDQYLRDEIAKAVQSAVDARVGEAIREFEQERGNDQRATEGWQATVEALQIGQVEALLWNGYSDDPERAGLLSIGPGAGQVAFDDATIAETGAEWIDHVRADAAVLRAAVGTRADLVLTNSDQVDLADGIGALLRFTTGSANP